jgi:hypothetical protein
MGFSMSSSESESSGWLSEGSGSGGKNLGKGSLMIEGLESGSELESGGGVSGVSSYLSSTGAGAGTLEEVLTL